MKRGPKPKDTIKPFVIETGIPLPKRGVRKETELFQRKLRPIATKMKPLQSTPIPKRNVNVARVFLKKEFPSRIYQVVPIADNPAFVRIFRKK